MITLNLNKEELNMVIEGLKSNIDAWESMANKCSSQENKQKCKNNAQAYVNLLRKLELSICPTIKWYVISTYYNDGKIASVILNDEDFDTDCDWRPRSGKYETYIQCVDVFDDLTEAENFKKRILA